MLTEHCHPCVPLNVGWIYEWMATFSTFDPVVSWLHFRESAERPACSMPVVFMKEEQEVIVQGDWSLHWGPWWDMHNSVITWEPLHSMTGIDGWMLHDWLVTEWNFFFPVSFPSSNVMCSLVNEDFKSTSTTGGLHCENFLMTDNRHWFHAIRNTDTLWRLLHESVWHSGNTQPIHIQDTEC